MSLCQQRTKSWVLERNGAKLSSLPALQTKIQIKQFSYYISTQEEAVGTTSGNEIDGRHRESVADSYGNLTKKKYYLITK